MASVRSIATSEEFAQGYNAGLNLVGTADDDELYGSAGQDKLHGGGGDDRLYGGTDHDELYGDAGDDRLYGGSGLDLLVGGSGADRLVGGSDADTLIDGDEGDVLIGGSGDDHYRISGPVELVEGESGGRDTIYAIELELLRLPEHFEDIIMHDTRVAYGNDADNRITPEDEFDATITDYSLYGLGGNDLLYGASGDNRLEGGSGNDSLVGAAGDDTLIGGDGDDRLEGGNDRDRLSGGDGQDVFAYGWSDESGPSADTRDRITDFEPGDDRIDLQRVDANRATPDDDAFGVLLDADDAFSEPGQLRFADGVLYGNVDDDAQAELAIELTGIETLQWQDLVT
ncbi:calcium-binding protein [Azotobacter bryophylli]|uniref:Calcium-binding protein n=1 Tax=Azotobacter bryophylli TaxID=1986537 RepID=A0ABV7AZF3_9GAMM